MEFKNPKSKKNPPEQRKHFVPIPNEQRVGVFNGLNVTVFDWNSMNDLYFSGNFGKGNLSKSAPTYHVKKDDIPKIVYEQQFENQAKWNVDNIQCETCPLKHSVYVKQHLKLSLESVNRFLQSSFEDDNKESWKSWKEKNNIIVSTDSQKNDDRGKTFLIEREIDEDRVDENFSKLVNGILESKQGKQINVIMPTSEEVIIVNTENNPKGGDMSLDNVSSRLTQRPFLIEENLKLSLEEAFFLKFVLGSLRIVDLNYKELSLHDIWEKFNNVQPNFLERYATYHYYRANGWVVKSGVKFGGDFLLYKDGPAYYHASYLIKVLDRRKNMTWRDFIGMNRLAETFNKDLVLCEVICHSPEAEGETEFPDNLKNYSVHEVLVRRWFPSKEKASKDDSD